jgi:hypothetical protein
MRRVLAAVTPASGTIGAAPITRFASIWTWVAFAGWLAALA